MSLYFLLKMMNRIIIIFLITLLVSWQGVQAAGISVKPSELNFSLEAKSQTSQTIVIENISFEPVIYNLYVDELGDQIILQPTNFRLEVGEKQKVKVKVSPQKAGTFATNLSIVAQVLDRRKFNVSTGVKVPLTIQVSPAPKVPLSAILKKVIIVLLPLLIIALAVTLLVRRKRKRWWRKAGESAINLLHHKKPWWRRLID